MTKVAAIAPVIAGLSAPAALGIGLGLTGAGVLLNQHGQRQHNKRQEAANNRWVAFQNAQQDRFERMDEENRLQSQGLLDENLQTQENVSDTIATETDRLTGEWAGNGPTAQEVFTSGQTGTSQEFDSAASSAIANATADARKRIQAMAQATAYGGGSMGSRGAVEADAFANAAGGIGGINTNRRGDLNSFSKYQQIEPEILEYKQSPLVPLLQVAGSFVGGGGASSLAESMISPALTSDLVGQVSRTVSPGLFGGVAPMTGAGGGMAPLLTPTGGANPFGRTPWVPMTPTGSLY